MTPAEVACPSCHEAGCERCTGLGYFSLTTCPVQFVDDDCSELIRLAVLFEMGLPPVAGGVLDQSHWFVEACAFLWAEQAYHRRHLRITKD